ncbi:septin-12 [Hyperolius riggenbachi]|uniref:septin-12 n=1 Tax=Hyperolius riggenbachi TaxID=752182 RepID=UPI0035A27FAE
MTHLSVNDHLEGILSDFEALKRSFDMEDIDDTPVFTPTSSLSSPFSPNHGSVPRASNGDSQMSTGSHQPLYQSHIRISSSSSPSQSPVLKSRITSSLSFNRGTMQMAKTNGSAGQGLTRVSSFQTRLHPSGFSSPRHGSDSESLHSSTSSLECPAPMKPFQPLRPTQTPIGQHGSGVTMSNVTSPVLKKFSSHGNVFHSEVERPGVRLVPVTAKNHGSLPSLDLHITEDSVPDLVPSPDAGYPPSEGWNSPTPDFKRPSSRNTTKSISREPSFSSSSASSSPPAECAPINCDLTSSPSPPPIFGPLQHTTLQKFPLSLQSPIGKPNGSIADQFNRPLPRTQLRVNLNATPGVSSQVSKEKSPVKSQSQIPSIGRTSSHNFAAPVSPITSSRLPPAHQDSLQESNFNHNLKPSELHHSSDRLRSMMQRAHSFTKADNLQDQYVQDDLVNEKSTGYLPNNVKSIQEPACYEKSPLVTRIQGGGHSTSTTYLQDNQQSHNVPETTLESINGIPPLQNHLQSEPQIIVPPTATPFKQPSGLLRSSERREEEKLKTRDSGLEDFDHSSRPESVGPMEELSVVSPAEEDMETKICKELGREPFGYVGIDSVLDQMKRKAMKYGFEFNIMVVGQSGLGKSTLVNTLFKSKVIRKPPGGGIPKTLELKSISRGSPKLKQTHQMYLTTARLVKSAHIQGASVPQGPAPANVFILLVILRDVVNSRRLPINDQLIFGICFFNVLHQLTFIFGDIVVLVNRELLLNNVLHMAIDNLSVAFMLCCFWLSTLLSVYFCLKIVNMKQKSYILLQKTFPKLFHKFLVVIVVGSLVLPFCSYFLSSYHGFQNSTFHDNGHQLAFTMHEHDTYLKLLVSSLSTVSFLVLCLCVGIITSSLCRHIGNIQANPGSSRAISTQAHTHAIVNILLLLMSSIMWVFTELIWIVPNVYHIAILAMAAFSSLHHVSTPLILIMGNRKLEKSFCKFLSWCPISKKSDI